MIHLVRDIEGRQIKIFYYEIDSQFLENNKEFMKMLDEQIISVCKEDESAKHFPILNFLVFGKNKLRILRLFVNNKVICLDDYKASGFIRSDHEAQAKIGTEILKNDCTVYINSNKIIDTILEEKSSGKFEQIPTEIRLAGVVAHELMHLRHFQLSRESKTYDTGVRLSGAIEKINCSNTLGVLQSTRIKLYTMLEKTISEGIARFKQSQKTGHTGDLAIDYTKKCFVNTYESATVCIKEILNPLNNIFTEYDIYLKKNKGSIEIVRKNYKKIDNLVNDNCKPYINYEMGFHMIYTIIYDNKDMNINMLAEMDYMQIIRLYENAMIRQGYQPVISYSSGKGMFDYANWLEKINDTYNNVEKHEKKNKTADKLMIQKY